MMHAMAPLFLAAMLLAHDWYPFECCRGQDCHPVPCSEVDGLKWRSYAFPSIRPSPDGQCHVCIHDSQPPFRGQPLCLFVPEGMS